MMIMCKYTLMFSVCFLILSTLNSSAQNPLILDQYTADPTARVFDGKVYVYPSHDIRIDTGRFANWFCMEDYHVFSSENLTEWTDHGVILNQTDVAWVDDKTYSMWAPDCISKNGKYYFYFPAIAKDKSVRRGSRVGVATADSPSGPFIPQKKPMEGVYGIDPNTFIDTDGQAYMYWGGGKTLFMAKLKENMLEIEGEPQQVMTLPDKFKEGPFLFERNGKYYFTFPNVPETTERLAYVVGDNPMGPFSNGGVIMDESPVGCWTNHHSIIEFEEQWYLFYHHNDLSPNFDKNRSIKADSLFFNEDGTIQKVIPSNRGVGLTKAQSIIQPDRYSNLSAEGASISFLDSLNTMQGWKTVLTSSQSWVRYNKVEFHDGVGQINLSVLSEKGATVEIRLDTHDGDLIAKVKIERGTEWKDLTEDLLKSPSGIHDLFILLSDTSEVEIDWISFQ